MELRENLSFDDLVENWMDLLQRSNMAKINISKRRKIFAIMAIIGVILAIIGIIGKYTLLQILGLLYLTWGLIESAFARQRYLRYNRKNMRKNLEATAKQYGIADTAIESVTNIEDDHIAMTERGTSTIYRKVDYLGNTENERSYIIEFTNGRYIYFKKSSFANKEHFLQVLHAITSSANQVSTPST